jgi:hypothetical protein
MRLFTRLLLGATAALLMSGATDTQGEFTTVPFVGCESYGQTQKLQAPKGQARQLPIASKDAEELSYYASADGIGVLGPRAWYCEGVSGSSGFALFLAPHESDLKDRIRKHLEGPAIEIEHIDSEASGTWEVAEFEARIFPAFRASARKF